MKQSQTVLGIENGAFSYAEEVFSNVTFMLDRARTALVGDNGIGKSTLMKCLAGDLDLNVGQIIKSRGARVSYVPQEIPAAVKAMIIADYLRSRLAHPDETWRVDSLTSELGLYDVAETKTFGELSGGWQRFLVIAAATELEEPDIILLDEPTNDLDLKKIIQLEDWLMDRPTIPLLIISHDRDFLDKITDRTIFLRSDGVHMFRLPLSKSRQQLLQRDAAHARQRAAEEKEIERLEVMAKMYADWGVRNSDFHKKMKTTQKRIERIQEDKAQVYKERRRDLVIYSTEINADFLLKIENFTVTTPDGRVLYTIPRLVVCPGERVALLGQNGAGKSVLFQSIFDAYTKGGTDHITFNPRLRLGYFDQKAMQLPDKTLIQLVQDILLCEERLALPYLIRAGFGYRRKDEFIEKQSAGERARLLFLGLQLQKPNFLLADEPTNHLDLSAQEDLETGFGNTDTACLFVSHDRRFIRTATRYVEIIGKRLVDVDGPEEFYERLLKHDG